MFSGTLEKHALIQQVKFDEIEECHLQKVKSNSKLKIEDWCIY